MTVLVPGDGKAQRTRDWSTTNCQTGRGPCLKIDKVSGTADAWVCGPERACSRARVTVAVGGPFDGRRGDPGLCQRHAPGGVDPEPLRHQQSSSS